MTLSNQSEYLKDINNGCGYTLDVKLSTQELEQVRSFIHNHAVSIVTRYYPQHASRFEKTPMDEFHLLSDLIDHKKVWTKINRIFPEDVIKQIKKMPFFSKLESMFGDIKIANEESLLDEEIYWRFVRPKQKNDVGPLHADKWFWDLGHGVMPKGYFRLKIWVPIWCDEKGNGLRVVPNSQKENYQCEKELRDGFYKPVFDESKYSFDVLPLDNAPGESIVFHDKLLHGGCVNNMEKSRVSFEFTILVPENG